METTIALGILMIGVLATITLMLYAFDYVRQSEHEIVVVNLAREGVELVRSGRYDQSCEGGNSPGADCLIDADCGGGGICESNFFNSIYDFNDKSFIIESDQNDFDHAFINNNQVTNGDIQSCSECQLYLTPNGRYTHTPTGNQSTIYKRRIKILASSHSDEKIILSEVFWQEKGRTHNYILESVITNWQ